MVNSQWINQPLESKTQENLAKFTFALNRLTFMVFGSVVSGDRRGAIEAEMSLWRQNLEGVIK